MMTWLKLKFALGLGVAALLVMAPLVATSQKEGNNEITEYEVDGELTIQFLGENNKVTSEEHESFMVSVKDNKWFIITKPQPSPNISADTTRYEAGGDGEAFYQVAYFDKKTLAPTSLNSAIGLIENDAVPENIAGNQVSEIWLALASSSYLNKSKNGMIEPVYSLIDSSMRNKGWVEKANWKRFQASPHLPQELSYLNKNIIGVNGRQRFLFTPPPPFEKGFTRAAYMADEVTNINGLTLPAKFSFKEFYVDQKAFPAGLKANRNVQGTVTDVRTVCTRTNFIPELTEATYVDDRRFAHSTKPVKALAYMITNGVWPATNAEWLQKSYQYEVNVRADMIKPSHTRVTLFAAAIALVCILSFVAWRYSRRMP